MKIVANCSINAPLFEVFNTFSDLNSLAENVDAIKHIEVLTPGDIGVGTKFKETRMMSGKESIDEMEVTEFSSPHYFKEEAFSGGMHYVNEWRFSQVEEEVKVEITFTTTASSIGAKLLNIMFFFMKGSMTKAFLADMADLKKVLEANH